jgi:hypothetical protein
MKEGEEKQDIKGDGTDFIKERKAVDKAINERMKGEDNSEIDPRTANNKNKAEYDPRDSVKKTGRTKR